MRATEEIILREYERTDSLEELTELLHRAYASLAEQGLRYYATYQSAEVTGSRIERGTCFVATCSSKLIGTITYYPPDKTHGSPWLNRPHVAHFGQFGVDPDYQKMGIGSRLLEKVENRAVFDGAIELALDTAEPAKQLIEWYTRLGFRFVESADWEATNYRSVVMSKAVSES